MLRNGVTCKSFSLEAILVPKRMNNACTSRSHESLGLKFIISNLQILHSSWTYASTLLFYNLAYFITIWVIAENCSSCQEGQVTLEMPFRTKPPTKKVENGNYHHSHINIVTAAVLKELDLASCTASEDQPHNNFYRRQIPEVSNISSTKTLITCWLQIPSSKKWIHKAFQNCHQLKQDILRDECCPCVL